MTRHPVIRFRASNFDGDPCVTALWCCDAEYPEPTWVGPAFGTTEDAALACLAARSALRAQPASGELLRAVLGELFTRPGLVEQAALRCEHFARGTDADATNLYEWDKTFGGAEFAAINQTMRLAYAAACRQTARLLRNLVTP